MASVSVSSSSSDPVTSFPYSIYYAGASGAQMFKNTASQKVTIFAFADAGHATLDAGEPVTGDAANITCKVSIDDAAAGAVTDTNPTEVEDGKYNFDLTQAETNGDKLLFLPESSTAGVQVIALPSMVVYTRSANIPLTASEVNAEVVDALNIDTYAEPGQGAPAATASLVTKIGYLYKNWRNRKTQSATTFRLYNDDATTVDQKTTVSDNGSTAGKSEFLSGP